MILASYEDRDVAVKLIDKRSGSEYVRRFLQRELDVIKRLNHRHIVKVYKVVSFFGNSKNFVLKIS